MNSETRRIAKILSLKKLAPKVIGNWQQIVEFEIMNNVTLNLVLKINTAIGCMYASNCVLFPQK